MTNHIFAAIMFSIIVSFIWLMYCNNKTFKQRIQIIRNIGNNGSSFSMFNKVSYDTHVWCLVFFMNPYKKYSKEIQDCIGM